MANNYNELKVFTLNSLGGPAVVNVYLCRGIACDVMRDWGRFYRDNARIEESQILFCGDSPEKGATLYRRFEWDNGHETGRVTPWYLTDDEAIKAAEAMHFKPIDVFNGKKYYAYQTGYLNTEFIEPIQQVEVEFKLNDKGRLYTRLNAHPERDGKNISGGKFFFPDKSFTTADVGKAVVSVSKEFDNFGFLVGKMKKVDDIPEIKDILDWAWEKRAPHEELITINHPGRGRYYAVNDGEDIFPICQMQFLDEDHPHIYADEYTWIPAELDAERYIEDRATFFELFAKDACSIVVCMAQLLEAHPEWDMPQAVAAAEDLIRRSRMCFIPNELEFLRAGGRVSNAAAMCGKLLGIHPLIEIQDGRLVATKKLRGKLEKIATRLLEDYATAQNLDSEELWLIWAPGFPDGLHTTVEQAAKNCGFRNINWVKTGGVITTHGGPGAFGIVGFTS